MTNIEETITKLLALSKSPVEAEAKAALLKARELTVKYKLSLSDLQDGPTPQPSQVIEVITNITFTTRRDPWLASLSSVIAKNHCCMSFVRREERRQIRTIGFWGLPDDVNICNHVFQYAVNCVQTWIQKRKRALRSLSAEMRRMATDNYGMGFVDGLRAAYQKQEEEHQDWALSVAVKIPPEVLQHARGCKTTSFAVKSQVIQQLYNEGRQDGENFNPATRLEEKSRRLEQQNGNASASKSSKTKDGLKS